MADSELSRSLREIEDAGYLIERAEVRRGLIIFRARHDDLVLSASAPSDEEAVAKLLAIVRRAPAPGSPQAEAAKRREVVDRPEQWLPVRPRDGSNSN
jgi:hypothetical protein